MMSGDGLQWWRDMPEHQKSFWYAGRTRAEADRLQRRFRARRWYRLTAGYFLLVGWVWVIRGVPDAVHGWQGAVAMGIMTLFMGRALWLDYVVIRKVDLIGEGRDERGRRRIERGFGHKYGFSTIEDPNEVARIREQAKRRG